MRCALTRLTAVATAFMAVAAYGGAIGLIGNGEFIGPVQDDIGEHLPFHSFLIGGTALLVAVAIPVSVSSVAAWRATSNAGRLVIGAGACLVGWIVVESVVIRMFVWLQQPACFICGLVVIALGILMARRVGRRAGAQSF